VSDSLERPPREPMRDRLKRLGLTNGPPGPDPKRVTRTKRYYRDLDEISFNKPYTNKTK
jgi:hypothetical protein